jgi:hypothetical protein
MNDNLNLKMVSLNWWHRDPASDRVLRLSNITHTQSRKERILALIKKIEEKIHFEVAEQLEAERMKRYQHRPLPEASIEITYSKKIRQLIKRELDLIRGLVKAAEEEFELEKGVYKFGKEESNK